MLYYKRKDEYYFNIPLSFDIEVSSFMNNDKKQACMYAFVVGVYGKVFVGRTWSSFMKMYELLLAYFKPTIQEKLIIYVHNLSYEFQFIRKRFEWDKVFALDTRQVCYATTTDGVEFRCSYILSNYSLAKVGDNLQRYKVAKKVGDLDYRLIRTSKTPLTDKEWSYIFNDGLVVMCYIMESIENNKGIISRIPLTNTGYVRKYIRNCCFYSSSHHGNDNSKRSGYFYLMQTLTLEPEEYKLARLTFQGGFTHANALWQGDIINDVTSMDFTSSYPSVIVAEDRFPMSRGKEVSPKSIEEFNNYIKLYCCIMCIQICDLKARQQVPDHPLSYSHCRFVKEHINDNGRVVEAKELTTYLTELDYEILCQYYTFSKFKVIKMYIYRRGYLPTDFVKGVLKLYKDKTSLKGVTGKEVDYMHSKGMLNACYGMMVTDICRDEISYNDEEWSTLDCCIEEEIEKYNNSKSRFVSYLWGIYVSALARRNLFDGISHLKGDYIYSDTDSVKFINYAKHKAYFDNYNANVIAKLEKACIHHDISIDEIQPTTIKGEKKPLGVWDYDGHMKTFVTLGSKRYAYITDDNELHITISGVSKKNGKDYLMRKYKTAENALKHFNEDLEFPKTYTYNGELYEGSGKNIHTYIDDNCTGTIKDYLGKEAKYFERSCIYMEATSYCMSISEEYSYYLKGIHEMRL